MKIEIIRDGLDNKIIEDIKQITIISDKANKLEAHATDDGGYIYFIQE